MPLDPRMTASALATAFEPAARGEAIPAPDFRGLIRGGLMHAVGPTPAPHPAEGRAGFDPSTLALSSLPRRPVLALARVLPPRGTAHGSMGMHPDPCNLSVVTPPLTPPSRVLWGSRKYSAVRCPGIFDQKRLNFRFPAVCRQLIGPFLTAFDLLAALALVVAVACKLWR